MASRSLLRSLLRSPLCPPHRLSSTSPLTLHLSPLRSPLRSPFTSPLVSPPKFSARTMANDRSSLILVLYKGSLMAHHSERPPQCDSSMNHTPVCPSSLPLLCDTSTLHSYRSKEGPHTWCPLYFHLLDNRGSIFSMAYLKSCCFPFPHIPARRFDFLESWPGIS